MRHELRRKVAPIPMPLHARRVQQRTPARALKRSSSSPNLRRPNHTEALEPAISLTVIAVLANTYLSSAARPRTTEDPIPLIDHQRHARQFLDKRRESIDTVTYRRATTRRP